MDRPPELMSDAELAHALDQCDADLARTETRRLRLIAAMDESGYAERVRARDTVQYIEFRYRLDHSRAYRDVKLARALPKYAAVAAALPVDAAEGEEPPEVLLRPAQAEAIVTALEKVPTTVPVADIEFAEEELVRLARHLAPADLRKAAEQSRDILDTDGPEPEEDKAAARETLTLKTADRGVKFTGYLANENAELFRTFIFTGARPHKTVDGERDPRSREKRQADAPTTTLTLAATALDAGGPSPTIPRPAPPADPTPANSPQADSTEAGSTEAGSAEDTTIEAVSCPRSSSAGEVVPGFGAKANLTVTIDFEDLKAATADAIGHTVYSNGLSAATIRRLACDANVIPVVLGSNSEPPRRRTQPTPRHPRHTPRPQHPRPRLRDLQRATGHLRRTSPDLLDRRRRNQRRQPRALMPPRPHRPAPRPLDHHHHQRPSPRHQTHLGRPTIQPTTQTTRQRTPGTRATR